MILIYCNGYAKSELIDIKRILFFNDIGEHSFLCSGAQFSVQKRAIMSFLEGITGFRKDFCVFRVGYL
jgi:hypothetical protein